jgi:predicted acylesterase/phospholipase RssA
MSADQRRVDRNPRCWEDLSGRTGMSPLLGKRNRGDRVANVHTARLEQLTGRPYQLTTDAWEAVPQFGFDHLADAIAKVILESDPQLTLAVYGQWGLGKTTLLHAIRERIWSDDCAVAWFDTWEYQAQEQVIVHLLHAIAGALPPGSAAAKGLRMLARSALATASFKAGVVSLSGKDLLAEIDRTLETPRLESDQLKKQVNLWRTRASQRIVVIVDNLDRCLPGLAVELLDQITSLFGFEGVIFLLAADKERLEQAVERKHEMQPGDGALYLEKIVQVEFRVPGFARARVQAWIRTLAQASLDLHEEEVDLVAEVARWNPRQIKRILNNVRIQLCVTRDERGEHSLALASTLLLHYDPKVWLRLTSSESERANPTLSDGLTKRIAESRGGKALLALDAEAMSRFLTSAESSVSVSAAPDDDIFDRARAESARVCDLYLDATGVTALSVIGAVTALEEAGYTFGRVGGASAGAAIAALLAAGFTAAEVRDLLLQPEFAALGARRGRQRPRARRVHGWIEPLLADRGVRAFAHVQPRLTIVVADYDAGRQRVLPDELPELDSIAAAVAAGMTWPNLFDPANLELGGRHFALGDGRSLPGFRVDLFDAPDGTARTIGIRSFGEVKTPEQGVAGRELAGREVLAISAEDRARTIDVPNLGISPWNVGASHKRLLGLYDAGRSAAQEFLAVTPSPAGPVTHR